MKSDFLTQKVRRTFPTPTSKSKMAAPDMCCILALLSDLHASLSPSIAEHWLTYSNPVGFFNLLFWNLANASIAQLVG